MAIIAIMGITLGAASQSWRTIMQREREEELLFRGTQIRNAILKWRNPRPAPGTPTPPPRTLRDLKDLLEDPSSAGRVRYLRRLYTDPITNKDFDLITDPASGIVGVKSASQDPPMKRANFPDELKAFTDKDKYSDWQFSALLKP